MDRLSQEVLDVIISNLVYDTPSLKACSATCFVFYTVAAPYLHHTLNLRQWNATITRKDLNPLARFHELGLLPLFKRVRFRGYKYKSLWVLPEIFSSESLRYFSALVSVQDLVITGLDWSKFTSGFENYFGRFSPTLRSIAFPQLSCRPRQLLDILMLNSKLDDVRIIYYDPNPMYDTPRTKRAQIRGSLRGKLTLKTFWNRELLEVIIASFGGMRFVFLGLDVIKGVQLLLDTCAETLQTLHFGPELRFHRGFDLAQQGPPISGGSSFLQHSGSLPRSRSTPLNHHISCILRGRCRIFRQWGASAAMRLVRGIA